MKLQIHACLMNMWTQTALFNTLPPTTPLSPLVASRDQIWYFIKYFVLLFI